jgi:hypothetical protein
MLLGLLDSFSLRYLLIPVQIRDCLIVMETIMINIEILNQ